ncbi:hypothetical protein LAZ67_17002496, partial [Cordylochernes scorpioides]
MKSNREFENRAAIIVALRAGRSPKEIVDFLKLPKTTIYRVKKQFDEADSNKEGIATRKKHSRRSDRVRGEEFVKNVKEKIDGNPGKSMRAIAKEMDVGSMTIVRTIHEDLGLKSYALRKDVTLASSSLAIHATSGLLGEMAFTDHMPIWTTFLDMVNNETNSSWVKSSCKEQTFKSFLNSSLHQVTTQLNEASTPEDIDRVVLLLTSILQSACDSSMGRRSNTTRLSKPWWTPELSRIRRLVISLRRCSQSVRCPIRNFFRGLYRDCHNRLKAAIRKAKTSDSLTWQQSLVGIKYFCLSKLKFVCLLKMTTELPQIQKFNGDNFHLWKFQMKIILEAKDLLSITDGSEVKPEIEDIAKFSEWKKKDAKSKMLITTALEFKYLQQIVNCQTSAEMWKKLSTIYELKSETNKYLLQQRFFEYKMNPNDNIASHISKVEIQAQQLKDLGEPVSDVALITKIICSLPDKYKNFITAWDSVSSKEKTLENLTERLLKEESLQDHWDSSGNFKPDNALMTFSKFNRNSTDSNKHQQHKQSIKDKKKNTHCGYCKKKGHWWKECYKRKEEQKGQQPSSSARDDSCAFSAETSAFLAETKDSWIADSGATDHMTFRIEWFSPFEEIPEGVHPVCLGDGKQIYAKGKGNIDILSYVDSQEINATLLDVLYIPELESNLFSISTATKHGLTLICKGNQIKLTKNSKVLVTGIKDNSNLYRIFIKAKQSSQTHVAQLSLDIWHQRMGHVNPIKLTQMFENNVFEENIKIREKPGSLLCEACIYGKQNRNVFHASTSPNSTYPGELIYSDVCGPMSKRSPGVSLYFVSFKDDFSRFRVAYFIRHKSDVLEKFKEFVKRVRTETGNKIKRFRTDNGTEFLNKNFSDYLKSLGIVHELTAPYTPEQNGISERDNRTIVESARCLLHGRKMPLELWAEAVNTAVYLLNRCTTKVLGNSTPYEIWYKRKPSILHLKTFGCNAYVHIPKDNRKKLHKKSIRTFFVGYTETNKNYRMWDPIARKIIISRDVIFTEANTSENIQDNQQEQVTIYSEESVDSTNTSSKQEESCRYPLRNRIREKEQSSTSCTRAISYACYVHDQEPLNYEDAIVGQNSKQWKLAMDDEFNSLMKNQTWTYVTLPSDRKAIACKWVHKIKQNADGSSKMLKARLVAKGYSQKSGLDYCETFSPVVKFDSIRTILSLYASFDMEMIQLDVKSVPSDPYSKLTKEMCPKDNQEIEEMNKIPYRQTIGSLLYLMTGTRHDIAYAVSRVSQFMNNPGPSHWTAVKKIFGYLKATKNIGICFGGSSCTTSLIGFSDADFAGDLDTRKSTTGFVFMLNNGPISWCSQKQNCVSLSTTESEYIAASKAKKEAIWLRQFLGELHQEQVKPTTIFCDNQSCIRLVHNPEYHKRTKHIDISYHFIRDHFQKHAIDLLYVCSNDQAADIFTKALPPERYRRLRSQLGLFETTKCSSGGSVGKPGPATLPYPPDRRQLSFSLTIEEITTPII